MKGILKVIVKAVSKYVVMSERRAEGMGLDGRTQEKETEYFDIDCHDEFGF